MFRRSRIGAPLLHRNMIFRRQFDNAARRSPAMRGRHW
jgi:hypothetical protein